jgi:hypothetical protein
MEEQRQLLQKMLTEIKFFVRETFELYKLKGLKSASEIAGTFTFWLLLLVLLIPAFLLLNFSLAFLVAAWVDSLTLGFALVAVFYIVIGFIFLLCKKQVILAITNTIVKAIFKKT